MTPVDPLAVAASVAEALERVGLRYMIGGSVAASLMGEPRSTLDLDIMIERDVEKTRALARELSNSCYVDPESAVTAARERRFFNAIHLESSMKIDFFVAEEASLPAKPWRIAVASNCPIRRLFISTHLKISLPENCSGSAWEERSPSVSGGMSSACFDSIEAASISRDLTR